MPMCNIAAKRKVMASKTIRTPITMTMVVQRLLLISLMLTTPSPGTSSCNGLNDSPPIIYQNMVWLTKLLFPRLRPHLCILYTQPIQLNFPYTHCTTNFARCQCMKCRGDPRGRPAQGRPILGVGRWPPCGGSAAPQLPISPTYPLGFTLIVPQCV